MLPTSNLVVVRTSTAVSISKDPGAPLHALISSSLVTCSHASHSAARLSARRGVHPPCLILLPCPGVQIGDKILSIDRQTVAGLSLSDVGMRMGGMEGAASARRSADHVLHPLQEIILAL